MQSEKIYHEGLDGWFRARIAEKHQETESIFVYELVSPDGGQLPVFDAGAHVEVKVGDLIRHYSLCNPPSERGKYVIAVKRETGGRGGSIALCDTFRRDDTVLLRGPNHAFRLVNDAGASLLIAGGIGITPLLSMAAQLAAGGRRFNLHYMTRSREQAAFLARLDEAAFSDSVRLHFDDGPPELQAVLPDILASQERGTHLYICGPGSMIDRVIEVAEQAGWPRSHVHFERFSADVDSHARPRSGFQVKLRSSGQVVFVAPEKTVVEALREQAALNVPVSCEEGICGTCLVGLVDGLPDHRDAVLSESEKRENKLFVPCCSRALSGMLVLDL